MCTWRTGSTKPSRHGMMNTLEQDIVFFHAPWMHAIFVDVPTSVTFGWMYVIFRFLYPVLYALYGHFTVVVARWLASWLFLEVLFSS